MSGLFCYFFGDFLFQGFLINFSGVSDSRKFVHDFQAFGKLVHGQFFAFEKLDHFIKAEILAAFGDDVGAGPFAHFPVRIPYHGNRSYLGMIVEQAFNFRRINILAAADNHVFSTTQDPQAFLVEFHDITGGGPALGIENRGG